jgi:hypothetical protein
LGWWCGSSGTLPAYKVEGPELKPQYWPKNPKPPQNNNNKKQDLSISPYAEMLKLIFSPTLIMGKYQLSALE